MKNVFIIVIIILVTSAGVFFILPKEEKNMNFTWIKNITGNLPRIEKKKENIKMVFFGDLMLDRAVRDKIDKKGNNILDDLKEKDFLRGYNIVAANLEGTVTEGGEHYEPINKYDFAFREEDVLSVIDLGFNYFTLANNHFNDQGNQGQIETREFLDKNNIPYAGCFGEEVGECSYKILEVNNKKIGMLGFSLLSGRIEAPEFKEKMFEVVDKVKLEVDLVVVNLHWGNEYKTQFNSSQQKMAYELIDRGVDIIIGHHPHVTQGVEIYKSRPIFYSLGNFVFDQYFSEETQRGLAIGFDWDNEKLNINLYPFKSVISQVLLLENEGKTEFLGEIADRSKGAKDLLDQIRSGKFSLEISRN